MGDLTIRERIVEEQSSWPEKSTLFKPIPQRSQPNVPLGIGSSSQPWQNTPKPLHKLATIPENDATFVDASDLNTSNEVQANPDPLTDKKYRRTLSNRNSARRSRMRKVVYTGSLEHKAKTFENNIGLLHRRIVAQQQEKRFLQIENHTLKYQMAAQEKQRIIQEAEIEKNRAEVARLKAEVQRKTAAKAHAKNMMNFNLSGGRN